MEIWIDMIKRWLVIFALVGLFVPINASAPGGSGQSQPELRVTIHEVCKASFSFEDKGTSERDNLSATFEERNVYRITRYDNGEGLADLELVSHQANISPEGGGTYDSPPAGVSYSWTYQVDQDALRMLQSRPITGVDVSFTGGSVGVGVPSNPCGFVKSSNPIGVLGGWSRDEGEGLSLVPGEPSPFKRQLHSTFKPNSTSIAVQGHASLTDTALKGTVISREVDWSVSGGDTELPEAEIIPPDNYNTWLPEAGKDESTPGNVIVATVKLHKRGDPNKSAGKKAKFRFALSDVSQERGVCLNWPPYAQSKTTPDLKIDRKANPTLDPAGDGQSATTLKSGESATVTITSYDWGAYGHLTATAILDNNEGEITAHVQGGEKYDLTIPKDDNGNHIADFWEKTHAGGNAEADDDEQPPGNGDHGDGLSLYEEYRGFHVQGGHIWTNPKLKDIFIYDSTGLGVGYFARSGLAIHLVNANEFAQEAGSPNPRVINPNRGYATRGPQHVLGLTLGTLDGDYGFDDPSPGPPKSSINVIIDEQKCLERGVQELDTTIAHELAHACNVVHHGEGDYDMQFYRWLQKDGTWGRWQDDGCCWKVAAPGQEESGMQECIMRYDQANFYERALGSVQWKKGNALVRGEPYGPPEAPGTEFCDDPKGTGVNAVGRPGGPKAGNASLGKCKEQFLVNDTKH